MRIVEHLTDAERVRFIAAARKMVGTKFRHRGRTERGLDCVGLIGLSLDAVGRRFVDRPHYGRNPENDGLMDVCREHFGEPVEDMRSGDVVLFAWWDQITNRTPNHVGIIFDYPTGGPAMVHALKQNERVIDHRMDDFSLQRVVAVFRP